MMGEMALANWQKEFMQQLARDPLQSLVIPPGVRVVHAGALMYPHIVSTPVASPKSTLPSASLHFNQRHRYE